jgi:hypothetical protein
MSSQSTGTARELAVCARVSADAAKHAAQHAKDALLALQEATIAAEALERECRVHSNWMEVLADSAERLAQSLEATTQTESD